MVRSKAASVVTDDFLVEVVDARPASSHSGGWVLLNGSLLSDSAVQKVGIAVAGWMGASQYTHRLRQDDGEDPLDAYVWAMQTSFPKHKRRRTVAGEEVGTLPRNWKDQSRVIVYVRLLESRMLERDSSQRALPSLRDQSPSV